MSELFPPAQNNQLTDQPSEELIQKCRGKIAYLGVSITGLPPRHNRDYPVGYLFEAEDLSYVFDEPSEDAERLEADICKRLASSNPQLSVVEDDFWADAINQCFEESEGESNRDRISRLQAGLAMSYMSGNDLTPQQRIDSMDMNQESKNIVVLSVEKNYQGQFRGASYTVLGQPEEKIIEEIIDPEDPKDAQIIIDNIDKFTTLTHQQVANAIVDTYRAEDVIENLDKFQDLDLIALADRMVDNNAGYEIMKNRDIFPDTKIDQAFAVRMIEAGDGEIVGEFLEDYGELDYQLIVDKLIEKQEFSTIARGIKKFKGVNHQELVDRFLETKDGVDTLSTDFYKFEDVDHAKVCRTILESTRNPEFVKNIAYKIDLVEEGSRTKLAKKIIELGNYHKNGSYCTGPIANNLKSIPEEDRVEIAEMLIPATVMELAQNIEVLKGLDCNKILCKIIKYFWPSIIIEKLQCFDNLNIDVAGTLIDADNVEAVLDNLNCFEVNMSFISMLLNQRVDVSLIHEKLKEHNPETVPESFPWIIEHFGEYASGETLITAEMILKEQMVEYGLEQLGISKVGEAGLIELQGRLSDIRESVLRGEIPRDIQSSDMLLDYVKKLTRMDISEWGIRSTSGLRSIIGQKEHGLISDIYMPGDIDVFTKGGQKEFEIPIDAREEYSSLLEDILIARSVLVDNGRGYKIDTNKLQGLFNKIDQKIITRSEGIQKGICLIEAKLKENPENQSYINAIENMRKQLDSLSSFDIGVINNHEKLFERFDELARHKDFNRELRQLLFISSIMRFPNIGFSEKIKETDSPSIENINALSDFITHITKQETWSELFVQHSKNPKMLSEILGSKGLQHARDLDLKYSKASSSSKKFHLLPTRGHLMELSGHIADACWASTYNSIAKDFPNMTSVIFSRGEGADARFAGAMMLIEADSESEEPLLIIRGLNPLENDINQLDQESFVNQITEYVSVTAKKLGRKPAIVIAGQAGSSGTNRPALHDYLYGLRKSLKPVTPKDDQTKFNGYSITRSTYLL